MNFSIRFEDTPEQKRNIVPRQRRLGYPPVTPNACLRDTVSCAVFDYIWIEVRLTELKLWKMFWIIRHETYIA